MQDFSDKELIENYLAGDEKSLEILFHKYLKSLYNFVYWYVGDRQEAEDIAQEAFFRAWKNIKKFDQKKNFKTWIFAIAKNAAIDFLKKKKDAPFRDFSAQGGSATGGENDTDNFEDMIPDTAPFPDELLDRKDMVEVLERALDKLSPKYRVTLLLYYKEQLTFAEIAQIQGEPLNTIKSRYRRGLILLREIFTKIT